MLVEFTLSPVDEDVRGSRKIAEAIRAVTGPMGSDRSDASENRIEGDWEEVMDIIRRCHEGARRSVPHLVTTIKIQDGPGRDARSHDGIQSGQGKAATVGSPETANSQGSPVNEDD